MKGPHFIFVEFYFCYKEKRDNSFTMTSGEVPLSRAAEGDTMVDLAEG